MQKNGPSIQSTIQDALQILCRFRPDLTGASRTDQGVHALGQRAHVDLSHPIEKAPFLRSINALLPPAIRIMDVASVDPSFHARYHAQGKIYQYHIATRIDPCRRLYETPYFYPLDLSYLASAIPHLLGTRDFAPFASKSLGGIAEYDSIRTLLRIDITRRENGFSLEFEGDGFLYKMVRNLTGLLLDVGRRHYKAEEVPLLFQGKKRETYTAPAQGLSLLDVIYSSKKEPK